MQALIFQRDAAPLTASAALLATAFALGMIAPPVFTILLWGTVGAGLVFLMWRFPTVASVTWLLVAGLSLEMTLQDLVGDAAFQPTIAVVKGVQVLLAIICACRFGLRIDTLCPAWAFLAMLGIGVMRGLHPGLTIADSVRSAIGSVAPFAFCFCGVPRHWPRTIVVATTWAPVAALAAALPFTLFGVRPLFVDSGGARLAGLGHPAFLAGICLPAIYACLILLFRDGKRRHLGLLVCNGVILVLTGARAPLLYAVAVALVALFSTRSIGLSPRNRLLLVLTALTLLPVITVIAPSLSAIRVFNLLLHETTNLSGRDLLWPPFEAAIAASPWTGWGVGAGNTIIPAWGSVAQEMHTWAAHNEYLRIGVEGGGLGFGLLFGLFGAWVIRHTRHMAAAERRIMRLVFVAMAAHAFTDNLLISTPACVMFTFVAAVFAEERERSSASCARITLPDSDERA